MSVASDNIKAFLDPGSFVELGKYVSQRQTDFIGTNLEDKESVITGYGLVDGLLVYVYHQDISCYKGSLGEMHAKKILRLYELALKAKAPVIGFLDSAGIRAEESVDGLESLGAIYHIMSKASGVIPQLTVIEGNCGGGHTVMAGLSDITIMKDAARLFINPPNSIKNLHSDTTDVSSADYKSKETDLVDIVVGEDEIKGMLRQLVNLLPCSDEEDLSYEACEDDINRLCSMNLNDTKAMMVELADRNSFIELKPNFGRDTVTALARINGMTVGLVGNQDKKLSPRGCQKMIDLISLCDSFQIPIISLTNVNGFVNTLCAERNLGRQLPRLAHTFASASVPKVNLIVGDAVGSTAQVMNSKSLGADLVFAYPKASFGILTDDDATFTLFKEEERKDQEKILNSLHKEVLLAAKRGYVDDIIQPEDTRKYLVGALELLATKQVEYAGKRRSVL